MERILTISSLTSLGMVPIVLRVIGEIGIVQAVGMHFEWSSPLYENYLDAYKNGGKNV